MSPAEADQHSKCDMRSDRQTDDSVILCYVNSYVKSNSKYVWMSGI